MNASYKKHILNFKRASGTSRGVLHTKETWYIILEHEGKTGIGECGILRSLSIDDVPEYEEVLAWTCLNIHLGLNVLLDELKRFPSIQFGLEQAFISLQSDNLYELFPSDFTKGKEAININGLIWMGDEAFMKEQIEAKLSEGFSCIKMKIGAIDFQSELKLLRAIREEFSKDVIELRVDANGAFKPEEALDKLKQLAAFDLHSIEQPIRQGQWKEMAALCASTPLPIALDEELIGIFDFETKKELLEQIQPQYIILKPSLVGGYKGSEEWMKLADDYNIKYWITSALESNIGLNAISQWTYTLGLSMPQGLGTGSLYTNNIPAALKVAGGNLHYDTSLKWDFNI